MNTTPFRAAMAAIAIAAAAPSLAHAQAQVLTTHIMTDGDPAPVFAGWTAYMKSIAPTGPKTALEKQVETEVMAARTDLANAMEARDKARLHKYLPDDYVIILASGANMTGKAHVDMLANGQGPRFEVYPILFYDLKVSDRDNATLIGAYTFECPKDCPAGDYPKPLHGVMREVNVLHRDKDGWHWVLTHGLRVPIDAPAPAK
jgi:ketosteroid isomerase-like protein